MNEILGVTRTGTIEYYWENHYIEANAVIRDYGYGPYFSITGHIGSGTNIKNAGCIHKEIAQVFPDLAKYIKWHLSDIETGPIHYIANSLYHAGWTQFIDKMNIEHLKSTCVWGVVDSDSTIDLQSLMNNEKVAIPFKAKNFGLELTAVLEARKPELLNKMDEDLSELFGDDYSQIVSKFRA